MANINAWSQLAIYMDLVVCNFLLWLTFAPISKVTETHFGVGTQEVTMLSTTIGIAFLVSAVPSFLYLDLAGLRPAMLICASLGCVACVCRWVGCLMAGKAGYGLVLSGQVLIGFAQPLFMAAPAKLAREWFPSEQRGLATSLAVLSNTIGMVVPFLAALAVTQPSDLNGFSLVLLVLAGVQPLLVVFFVFRSSEWVSAEPPLSNASGVNDNITPPATNTAVLATPPPASSPSLGAMSVFLTNPSLFGTGLTFGFVVGGFWSLATEIEGLLKPHGFSHDQISEAGTVFLVSGSVGLLVVALGLDRFTPSVVALVCSVATVLGYIWLVSSLDPAHFGSLCAACSVVGFFASAVQPVFLHEAGRRARPGLEEGMSSGVLVGVACLIYVLESSLAPLGMVTDSDSCGFAMLLVASNAAATVALGIGFAITGDWGSPAAAASPLGCQEEERLRPCNSYGSAAATATATDSESSAGNT